MKYLLTSVLVLLSMHAGGARADYQDWKHSGSLYLLTTPDGADLPATSSVDGFPLLVRLHNDFFDFSQAQANGEDIRFSTSTGTPLVFQIEEWDADRGVAGIWVRIPTIKGNQRQELKLHWGKPSAKSESNGQAVFNESNGYLSVCHLNESVKDEVGLLEVKDVGTTSAPGIIGKGRRFSGKQGLFCGDKITHFPTDASPHTTQAWFRADQPNGRVVTWGNEHAQGKVVMMYSSPPAVKMDCYFSGANVSGSSRIPLAQWASVVHTYEKGASRVYVNGVLDGSSVTAGSPLGIKSPARMWIGGWYNVYDFVGDIDEVRISKVTRSADWVKLEYENQKPLQTLVGPLVEPGSEFAVSATTIDLPEGQSKTLTAKAGGAQQVYWVVKRAGRETVAATNRLTFTFDAGRVVRDESVTIQFKAVYANEVQSKDILVSIKEAIPEPIFALHGPKNWDGRSTIEIVPQISNLNELKARGAGELHTTWNVADIAVIKEAAPGKLLLKRAQNSGKLTVTATIDNGGQPTIHTAELVVTEPARDPWVARKAEKDEKPQENQFYARDDNNEGTLFYNGALAEAADTVFLKVYADDKLVTTESSPLGKDNSYAFTAKLKPGLIKYKVEFGSKSGGREKVLHTVGNLVCGDAFIITGQSNAVATDFGKDDPAFRSEWIRTFGSMSGSPQGVALWGDAVHRSRDAEKLQIGYWGMELARRLVESHKVPIFIINGAVGGTRIDQHQCNMSDPEDMTTIYGRLLWRVRQAKLTHGIRGVLWHQGENDQNADGPTGGFGWETYRQFFIELAASWKQDYPNIEHYHVFQIWPKSCSMGTDGSDNRLREVQRNLPTAFSNLSIMSTLGIDPPGGCHFPAAGYAEFARLIAPLVERNQYKTAVEKISITPPNLQRANYSNAQRNEIVLEFDQPVKWNDTLASQFYLAGEPGRIASGSVSGKTLILKLVGASSAKMITYLDSKAWSQKTLLRGENGIAALTFCEVPLEMKADSRR